MKRRRFIFYVAGSAAGVWMGSKTGLLNGSNSLFPRLKSSEDLVMARRSGRALGTEVRLTVFHDSLAEAEASMTRAFAELERVEALMSLYRPDSQLSQLNAAGSLREPHPAFLEVLREAKALSERSGGAFDVTIQPLWELYDAHAKEGTLPSQSEVERTLALVDWRRLELSPERVRLRGEGTRITLNGIAQGFAADRVAQVLKASGVGSALIDTGEIGALGSHIEKEAWTVGIKHPREKGAFVEKAALKNRCLATSGDYESRFGADFRYHHLLDPRTGGSAGQFASVSIAAPSAMQADALSTAVFVLGRDKGLRLVESLPGVDALFVAKDGKVSRTDGFPIITS